MSIIERVCLIGQEVKGNNCWYFEVMREDIDLVFHV